MFPNGLIFANTVEAQGYDIVMLGQASRARLTSSDRIAPRNSRIPVAHSLQQIGFFSGADLLATYVGQGRRFPAWLKDAVMNRDSNLRVQYLAGLNLDSAQRNRDLPAHDGLRPALLAQCFHRLRGAPRIPRSSHQIWYVALTKLSAQRILARLEPEGVPLYTPPTGGLHTGFWPCPAHWHSQKECSSI